MILLTEEAEEQRHDHAPVQTAGDEHVAVEP